MHLFPPTYWQGEGKLSLVSGSVSRLATWSEQVVLCHRRDLSEMVRSRLFLLYKIEHFVKAPKFKHPITLSQTLCFKDNTVVAYC